MAVCPRPCFERPLLRRLEGMAARALGGGGRFREEAGARWRAGREPLGGLE